ncbi:MAG: hypothetical protein ACK55I_10760, partial [bacterium]
MSVLRPRETTAIVSHATATRDPALKWCHGRAPMVVGATNRRSGGNLEAVRACRLAPQSSSRSVSSPLPFADMRRCAPLTTFEIIRCALNSH